MYSGLVYKREMRGGGGQIRIGDRGKKAIQAWSYLHGVDRAHGVRDKELASVAAALADNRARHHHGEEHNLSVTLNIDPFASVKVHPLGIALLPCADIVLLVPHCWGRGTD